MRRVVSLLLPHLAIERLRRLDRSASPPPERAALLLPVDADPGTCSVPRGGAGDWARAGLGLTGQRGRRWSIRSRRCRNMRVRRCASSAGVRRRQAIRSRRARSRTFQARVGQAVLSTKRRWH